MTKQFLYRGAAHNDGTPQLASPQADSPSPSTVRAIQKVFTTSQASFVRHLIQTRGNETEEIQQISYLPSQQLPALEIV